ncbi:MAG: LuxR family transcriptional regulator, partial [Actinomycetota bacterium]
AVGVIGRDEELTRALAALADRPGCVVIAGAAGVGKTHLAAAIGEQMRRDGHSVSRVVGTRTAASVPLGALAPLLPAMPPSPDFENAAAGAGTLVMLQHAIGSLSKEDEQAERDGVRRVLIIDDAQHLDATSAIVVSQLAVDGPVTTILTVRTDDAAPEPIRSLGTSGAALRIDLDPLDEEQSGALAAELLGMPLAGGTSHRLFSLGLGNPLYLEELIASARRDGALESSDGMWRLVDDWRPAIRAGRVSDLVRARFDQLDGDTREHLELLALSEPLDLGRAERIVGPATLEALEMAELISVHDRRVEIRHPLVGEVVRSGIAVTRRRRLYSILADHSDPNTDDDIGMMQHALWVLESGTVDRGLFAAATKFARFADNYALGLRFAEAIVADDEHFEATVLAGEMAYQLGDFAASASWLERAAQIATGPDEEALVIINQLSTVYWGLADWEQCNALVDDFRERYPNNDWADDLEGLVASQCMFNGQPDAALARLDGLRQRHDQRARVEVAFVTAPALGQKGRVADALEMAARGFAEHTELGEQVGLGASGNHVLTTLSVQSNGGLLADAEELGAAMYDAVRRSWQPLAIVIVCYTNGRTALAQGRPATAARWFREGAANARSALYRDPLRWCLGGLALALARTGDNDGGHDALTEATDLDGLARLADIDIQRAAALLRVNRGDVTGAAEELLAHAARWRAAGHAINEAHALHELISLGEPQLAGERLAALAAESDAVSIAVPAAHAAAMVAGDVDALEAVAADYEGYGAIFAAAETLAGAAIHARAAGEVRRATGLTARSRTLAEACEGSMNPVLMTGDEPTPLTKREREIALLAANGMRSKQIAETLTVSVRTVDNHLQNVYTKLGISDRADLANALTPS